MALMDPRQKDKSGRDLRQIGLLTAVPTLLLAGPLVGFFIGNWVDKKLGTEPYLAAAGVILGLAAVGIEIHNLLRKASATGEEEDDE
ncbi:MAG: AtpZ/AtpI family protein [candidate division Zixibacteria bacterium]|nr:AtpZ/AtpI family protein [candidate division Zixibacteria bacterium]